MVRLADSEIAVAGYALIEQLYASPKTLVYRALRKADHKPVVLKLLRNETPSYKELVQFRNQYTLLNRLLESNIDDAQKIGIIQPYSLETWENRHILVMEDFGGISLAQLAQGQALEISKFLPIALQLTEILHYLYQHQVIHKDLKPGNILIHPESGQVKLIGFAISSILPRETQASQNPNGLEGTLDYLAPEQTGRMNRGIDYRSDFYALGVTFYELLTGTLPFPASDSMELIHAHLAKVPTPIHIVNPDIPVVLSQMVAKLMAKNAEDRYQSALGLKQDLETCWQQWQASGTIAEFAIAQQDTSDRFTLPEKLYGRSNEVNALLSAFERASLGRAELMLVAGYSGIGKTAIVNEVHKPISRMRGYFIEGKYDQFQRNIPFSAIVQAFQNLVQQLLKESNTQIERWREKILQAVGENGQVIIDVIPEVELLIGSQPAIAQLDATASQNRLNWVFQQFIQVFPSADHPLVIFLDDLQWADSASLNLLQTLLSETDLHHLLLMGAYRDNEVNSVHPLMLTLQQIQKQGVAMNTIELFPLSLRDLNQLVADTLHRCEEDVSALTQLVFTKTKGNPFFSTQFLKSLYDSGLIAFNAKAGLWEWEIDQIQSLSVIGNVVEFMVAQLQKLPESTQTLLKFAACIGSKFDLKTLARVSGTPQVDAAIALWDALHTGLILSPLSHTLNPDALRSHQVDLQFMVTPYSFLHDRVQQAAYRLIPNAQKAQTHLQIGQLLLDNTTPEERESQIFEIVNHLNQGKALIPSTQHLDLAQLNLQAAQKAIATTSYRTALEYATTGIALLPIDLWQSQYELTLRLYEVATEAASLSGSFEQMEEWAEIALQQAKTPFDCLKINTIRIQACSSQNKLFEAITIARTALNSFGVSFPEHPTLEELQQVFQETALCIAGKSSDELLNLPVMSDRQTLAIMQIAAEMIPPVYLAIPQLYPFIICLMVRLSVQHGNALISSTTYAGYSLLLSGVLEDIELGDQFGQIALKLAERFNSKAINTRTYYILGAFVVHWKAHIRETLPLFLNSYRNGLEAGDLEFVGYAAKDICQYSYFLGQELTELEAKMQAYSQVLANFKQSANLTTCQTFWQVVLNLLGHAEIPWVLTGKATDEALLLSTLSEANNLTGLHYFYLHKLILCYLFGQFDQAAEQANQAASYLTNGRGFATIPIFHFYDSLTALAIYRDRPSDQEALLQRVTVNQAKLEAWAQHAPMNLLHKYYLVEAERHRVLGEPVQAMELYDRAITLAQEQEFLNEAALAYERAGQFYLDWGKEIIAEAYLVNAYRAYDRWGAHAKLKDLEHRYAPYLTTILAPVLASHPGSMVLLPPAIESMNRTPTTQNTSSISISETLDFTTVLKASQVLSSEIQLDKLLSTLMQVMLENAGAQTGTLLLCQGNEFVIQAQASRGQNPGDQPLHITVLQAIPVQDCKDIPLSVINYVSRTLKTLVIDDATIDPTFATDPYILEHPLKSVLCSPIRKQGKLIGMLYLENNLTRGAFTHDRLQVLKLLTAQAAASLDNALLYERLSVANQQLEEYSIILEQRVAVRTEDLNQKTNHLEQTLQKLQHTQTQLIQAEKMSGLGQLVAGIAHEINNPVNFIHGNLRPTREYIQSLVNLVTLYQQEYPTPTSAIEEMTEELDLEFLLADLSKLLNSMQVGSDRIRAIVLGLRNFSRLDEADMKFVDLHEGIESTLMILQHRLKGKPNSPGIAVVKDLGDLPIVGCYPGQLNQVLMNLLNNAIDALEERQSTSDGNFQPQICVRTELGDPDWVRIRVADNGCGMPETVRQKIFDPFFTTKPIGSGTGLGLSISYQIVVEKHQGRLMCESTPNKGTEFIVEIPVHHSMTLQSSTVHEEG